MARSGTATGLGALCLASLICSGASASQPVGAPDTLTPLVARLSAPAVRSKSAELQARRLGLPFRGAASLLREHRRYVVDVSFYRGVAGHGDALRRAGARIVAVSRRYRTATIAAPATKLRAIGRIPGVETVREELAPMVSGAARKQSTACQGSVVSEGDAQLGAAGARAKFGVDGSGVTVGVLSDSFDRATNPHTNAADDVTTRDLPGPGDPCGHTTPVSVLQDGTGFDEGRAMLQIVHDLAPGARLAFATAHLGEISFADNIRALASAGATVIVDDVTYFDEPFFQDGPVSNAVNAVSRAGVAYFSSATNNNVPSGTVPNAASFEAPAFRDSGSCPSGLPSYAHHCMDFDPSNRTDNTYGVTVGPGSALTIDLQWAQPWYGVTTDLDAYVLYNGVLVNGLGGSENVNVAGAPGSINEPFELVEVTNQGSSPANVDVAIDRCDAACGTSRGSAGGDSGAPRMKLQLLENGDDSTFPNEYVTSSGGDVVGPSIFGHNGAAGAVSTGAVSFHDSSEVEDYSSPGPVTLYYGPTAGTTPAAPLGAPEVLAKPEVAATDCGATTFFARFDGSAWRFCGTSESAPHAAAVGALELQANPSATPADVLGAQTSTAQPVGSFGADVVGAGLIDAQGAVDAVAAPAMRIDAHPRRRSRSRRARFQFTSSEPARLECKLDSGDYRPCTSPKAYTVSRAHHTFRVRGADGIGQIGAPAEFSWRVKKKRHHRH